MDYEEEFNETSDRISRYLKDYKLQGNRNLERDIEKNIELAEKLCNRMEAETLDAQIKRQANRFQKKVKQQKGEFEKIKNQLNRDSLTLDQNYSEKDSLLQDSRTKNLGNMKRVEESSKSIARSIQVLDEIENQGINTSSTLRAQRDQIIGHTEKVNAVNDNANQAGTIVTRLGRRQITNVIILISVIVLLVIAIILIIGFTGFFILRPFIPSGGNQ
eukprot:gene6318-10325_t